MRIEFSFDDGHQLDFKVADLLRKYEFPATFYIPSNCDLTANLIKEISKDFEIGGHTISHPADIKILDDESLKQEIEGNKRWLQVVIGKDITSFCYPKGRYDERVKQAVKDAGYKEARTTKVLCFSEPVDLFEKGTSIHCYQRAEYGGVDWLKVALANYHRLQNDPNAVFHIWGHSWEIEKYNDWGKFEALLKTISEFLK